MTSSPKPVTRLLLDWNNGNKAALDQLIPLVYGELRGLAKRYMRRERQGHTLQTSALINEAYLRLVDQNVPWRNRDHFFGIAARLMRRILTDHARAHCCAKRGGERIRVPLEEAVNVAQRQASELIALDEALTSLAALDPRESRIVELRFFGGLTIEQTARVLGVSHTIVEREWSAARAWLQREMTKAAQLE